jgi:hypothetical protein
MVSDFFAALQQGLLCISICVIAPVGSEQLSMAFMLSFWCRDLKTVEKQESEVDTF